MFTYEKESAVDLETLTVPGALIGFRRDGRPIYLAAGGAPDDDGGADDGADDDTGADDGADETEDDGAEDKPDPKATRKPAPKAADEDPQAAELARVRAALKRANAEAKRHRTEADELRAKNETADEAAARAAREEGAAAVTARLKPVAIRAEASSAFLMAGAAVTDDAGAVSAAKVARLLKLVDMSAVDVDDDGVVTGLDDQVEAIKADYPELFTSGAKAEPQRRAKPGPADGADRKPEKDKPQTSAQKLAALLG